MNKLFEWAGALLGIAGGLLLAFNTSISGDGWLLYLISDFFLIALAVRTKAWGLVTMFSIYTIIAMIGVYSWLIK